MLLDISKVFVENLKYSIPPLLFFKKTMICFKSRPLFKKMQIFADCCVKFVASDTSVQTGQLTLRHHRYL